MADKTKALLIKNSSTSKSGKRGEWHLFDEAQPYIQGIETNIDKEVDAEVMNTLVSGIPTPWARARLFGFAFPYTQLEANIKKSGLVEFYDRLVAEWKGIMACIALFPDRIRVSEPIPMNYAAADSLFDIPSALGRMLFEDEDLWTNPLKRKENPDEKPATQLIYYAGKLIGATSPYSLVFTSVDYTGLSQTADMPWYRNGSFVDPLPFIERNKDQLQKLYLLIKNINDHFEDFEREVNLNRGNKPRLEFDGFKDFLRKWQQTIKTTGTGIVDEGTLDAALNFADPYHSLFNVKQSLYIFRDGRVSFKPRKEDGIVEVDPKDILLNEDYIIEFVEEDEKQPLRQSALHFVEVLNPGYNPREPEKEPQFLYFPIPLSEKGLILFRNQIGDLIGTPKDNHHELRCYVKPSDYKLVVELHLVIDDKKMNLTAREYEMQPLENDRRVIIWPNFISESWNSYYLYSEFPQADRGTKMVPFFKKASDQSILVNEKGKIIYAHQVMPGSILKVEKLISYPGGTLDSSFHKYDIIKTNLPVAGLEIRKNIDGEERVVGYLIVKKPEDDSMGDTKIKDLSRVSSFMDVVVGIDFGSNNSCVQYARINGSDVKPIPFSNRRMVLVGSENLDPGNLKIAMPHELYFFQNETTPNGQIKSWVHEHNAQYLVSGMEEEEIAGGVPIFEPNIHIKSMDSRSITTNAGILHHSMKWLTEEKDNKKKSAYLKAIYLKSIADLYANNCRPQKLRWSFPGSFTNGEQLQYRGLFHNIVSSIQPIDNFSVTLDESPLTESEAVSNYALATGVSLQEDNVFLGIDVGGSTSDILLIAMDLSDGGGYKLVKQSSLRLAAGLIADASRQSESFRRALVSYHDNPKSALTIPNIKTINAENAPFFLNAVFDRLRGNEFEHFYAFLGRTNPTLFALPAYMTGLLLYYSGQLLRKTIEDYPFLSDVNKVNLFPFGKGGRIFDWLDTYPGKQMASAYFTRCLQAGFGSGGEKITVYKQNDIREDNKSEVAKGLVSATAEERVKLGNNLRNNSDIFGESGFAIRKEGNELEEVPHIATISSEHFESLNLKLKFPSAYQEFNKFLDIYLDFVGPSQTGIISNTRGLKEKTAELSNYLKGYITNDPEYKKAKNSSNFEFKHSMLVLEGICFLEKFLVPEIYKN
ncbi:MAG: hypothetical protein SF052_08940 [Bacteroidia bacterium]|nr:hypothetical protein [Bacteroidia bacterium]